MSNKIKVYISNKEIKKRISIKICVFYIKNNGVIKPISYKYVREKKDSINVIETFFDLDNKYAYTVNNNEKYEHAKIPYSFDRLSVQIDFQDKMSITSFIILWISFYILYLFLLAATHSLVRGFLNEIIDK